VELTELSATELARAIRTRTVTAVEVLEAHLAVLKDLNPVHNAVVAERFDEARREAEAADARVAAGGPLPPLLGVPCTIKESIAVQGMPNAAGVVDRRGLLATSSAPVVRRLVEAGAIVVGVTNTSELCMWVETENRLYGRTRNPYDPARTAGGSSGGEGVAVGGGGVPFGLGSDIGGSVRIPAFCCGVFGHKPSRGLVPGTGNYPPAGGRSTRLFTNGILARRSEDLMPLLRLISGPDGVDPLVTDEPSFKEPPPLNGLSVIVSEDAWPLPTSAELLYARERAAGALAAAGAHVEHRRMPRLRRAWDLYITTLARTSEQTARQVLGAEAVRLLRRGGPHTVATRVLLVAERVHGRIPARWASRMIEAGQELADGLCAAIGDGVLLHPPLATVAPRHGRTVGRPWWIGHMVPFNLAGLPVTQVPLGLGRAGLPLGVQVAAGPMRDDLTIAVAGELERVFGGWVPPRRATTV
jgi:fatty acid amide hydrolase 2